MLRELDHRQEGGIQVALDWDDETGAVIVTSLHDKTGRVDRLSVDPAQALNAYRHPYAYGG